MVELMGVEAPDHLLLTPGTGLFFAPVPDVSLLARRSVRRLR